MKQKALNAMRKMAGRMRRSAAPFKILQFYLEKETSVFSDGIFTSYLDDNVETKKKEDLPKNRTACVSIPLLSAMDS